MYCSFTTDEHRSTFNSLPKILIIGETKSGKSTFINYLYNYFHESDLNNLQHAIPSTSSPLSNEQSSSNETNNPVQYVFSDTTINKEYLFIDTPGLSDAHGPEQSKIIDFITQLGNLTSIIVVINGSTNRLSANFHSLISDLNDNLPDIILDNTIVILTHVNKSESIFDLKSLNLHGRVYVSYMQNNAFIGTNKDSTNSLRNEMQFNWNHSINQIKLILQTIDLNKQQSLDTFTQMKQIRNDIRSILHQACLQTVHLHKIQDELNLICNHPDQTYYQFQMIENIQLIDAPYYNTLCSNCNHVCHSNCHSNETIITDYQIYSQCIMINNGSCQQCPGHCSYKDHYYEKKSIEIRFDTLDNLIIEYNQFNENQTIDKIDNLFKKKLREIKMKCIQLYQIYSGFNLIKEFEYLINHLRIELNLLKVMKTKLQAEDLIRRLTNYINTTAQELKQSCRKRPTMDIIHQEQSISRRTADINYLKTYDLIELCHETTDRSFIALIINELHRRVQGKSIEPLVTSNQLIIVKQNLEKYNKKDIQELSSLYRKLQKQIDDIIKSEVRNILDVNFELLIENFIVHTLLSDKEKNQEKTTVETLPESSVQSMINTFPEPILSSPVSSNTEATNVNPVLIGFSHLIAPPYPLADDSTHMPTLPTDFVANIRSSSTNFCLDDYRRDSTDSSMTSANNDQDLIQIPMPMPSDNRQQTVNLVNSNTNFLVQQQPMVSPNINLTVVDVVPLDSDLPNSLNVVTDQKEVEDTPLSGS